ncbi:LOW QUALITY PROTEIN: uncharacterized protein LOC123586598 [Leopardus geoffroyi]|uniref:LOW QUALITY PROTEIN: uncharacterized protein LOC123586598 n=1 Tax=Leopardus geoffroyi TaxID=46844 RepID=UPI001E260F36|nr:LOW QUALITY PROTEIN: uncharacterized protein LOC123586598 [Leopardus geoffroyi]
MAKHRLPREVHTPPSLEETRSGYQPLESGLALGPSFAHKNAVEMTARLHQPLTLRGLAGAGLPGGLWDQLTPDFDQRANGIYRRRSRKSWLQTGMRGVFGKPQGTVAGVRTGQVVVSIRTKLRKKGPVMEAPRRAKFKFPGRQKIHVSKKWDFTEFNVDESEDMVAEKPFIPDGYGVKYIPHHSPLDKWRALHSRELQTARPHSCPPINPASCLNKQKANRKNPQKA